MNTVEVVFPDHIHTAEASPSLWQWDYGQRLIITGAPLPDSYEVHFCNAGDEGTKSKRGDMTGVDIPDEYLQTGKNIFAYIYLHTGMDDGETVYKITIKVKPRARPTEMFLTDVQHDALDQAIAQLEKYANATKNVDSVPVQNGGRLITSGGVYAALLGKVSKEAGKVLSSNDFTDEYKQMLDNLDETLGHVQPEFMIDTEPTAGSENLISSGAVAAALEHVQPELTVDQTPTENSGNPVSSGGVFAALAEMQSGTADEPDWRENDTSSPNYIKNRTHYTEQSYVSLVDTSFSQSNQYYPTSIRYSNSVYYLVASIERNTGYEKCIVPADYTIKCDGVETTVRSSFVENTESPDLKKVTAVTTDVYIVFTELSSGSIDFKLYLTFPISPRDVTIKRIDTIFHKLSNDYLNMDTQPVDGSTKPIMSGAVYDAINNTQAAVNNALASKQDALEFDSAPKYGSSNPVTSNGVYLALNTKTDAPDWTEDDTISPNYIRNRTHFSEEHFTLKKTCSTIKPTSSTSYRYFNGHRYYLIYSGTESIPCIYAGAKYSVTMGEQEAKFGARGTAFGTGPTSIDLEDIGLYIWSERDTTLSNYSLSIYAPYATEAQTIRIYSFYESVQKLDNKYLNLSTTVEPGNRNPVTSDAVYYAIESSKGTVDDRLSNISENPVQNKVIKAAIDKKQDKLSFDQAPAENSANPITSAGVYEAIADIRAQIDDELLYDSDNPVKNRAITAVINGLLDRIQELEDMIHEQENKLQGHIDGLDADGDIPLDNTTVDEDGYIVFDPSSDVEVDSDGYIVIG